MPNVKIQPSDRYIRSYQYYGDPEILYLVNEGTEVYEGSVYLPGRRESCYRYEAWENHLEAVKSRCTEKGLEISVRIEPGKSWILVFDEAGFMECKKVSLVSEERIRKLDTGWKRSVCESVAYPAFGEAAEVVLPDAAELEMPEFAGVLRYETSVTIEENETSLKKKSEEKDSEPPYRYEIGEWLRPGENQITVEVATTLERRIPPKNKPENWKPQNRIGLCGEVYFVKQKGGTIS